MKFGIHTMFTGAQHTPLAEFVTGVGRAIEERGFSTVWIAEHAVTFPRFDPSYPFPYNDDGAVPDYMSQIGVIEPMTALSALAMATKTLRLGSGIAILPQRNPVYFAKMGTSIDHLSNGRFIAGVGIGWSGQEYAALQTPWKDRGARMHEYLQVIRTLWCDEHARFDGNFYSLPECIQLPKPIQKPHPPFYFGGESEAAMRRVAEFGGGWLAFRITPTELAAKLPVLQQMLASHGKTLRDIEIVVSPADKPCSADDLARFAELGVGEFVMPCGGDTLDAFRAQLDQLRAAFPLLA
jgi:probable F420-dependent oxidoreductase